MLPNNVFLKRLIHQRPLNQKIIMFALAQRTKQVKNVDYIRDRKKPLKRI